MYTKVACFGVCIIVPPYLPACIDVAPYYVAVAYSLCTMIVIPISDPIGCLLLYVVCRSDICL